jgi:hypothetical protein
MAVQNQPGQIVYLKKKTITKKRAGRIVRVVRVHLPSKYEALNSNPSNAKKKKRKNYMCKGVYN